MKSPWKMEFTMIQMIFYIHHIITSIVSFVVFICTLECNNYWCFVFFLSPVGSLAYIGNSAVFDFNGYSLVGNLIAMYLWRSVYWSEQVSMRTRLLLMKDWVVRGIWGRDLSKVSTFDEIFFLTSLLSLRLLLILWSRFSSSKKVKLASSFLDFSQFSCISFFFLSTIRSFVYANTYIYCSLVFFLFRIEMSDLRLRQPVNSKSYFCDQKPSD